MGQGLQTELLLAPVLELYVPFSQPLQLFCPGALEKDPGWHSVQSLEPAMGEKEPLKQSIHAFASSVWPEVLPYLPAAHKAKQLGKLQASWFP
jgi:hypothetical protein